MEPRLAASWLAGTPGRRGCPPQEGLPRAGYGLGRAHLSSLEQVLGVMSLARAGQSHTPSAPERGLNLRRFSLGFMGKQLQGNKHIFVTSLWWLAPASTDISIESGTGPAFPNAFLTAKGQILSTCEQGMWPVNHDTKVPYSLPLSLGGPLIPQGEVRRDHSPSLLPALAFPFADRLRVAGSGRPGSPWPASSPGDSPLPVAPPGCWVGWRGRG